MRLFRPPFPVRLFYPQALMRLRTEKKELVLTFDDGPDPESTPGILEILERHNTRALFFCTGRNAEKYPELTGRIRSAGHKTGNHGYDHIDGLRYSEKDYAENAIRGAEFTSTEIFRPPYGRMRKSQYRLMAGNYRIIMWDLMPYDFDNRMKPGKCLDIMKKKTRPGSIIVLHDTGTSLVLSFLDEFLDFASSNGYVFVTDI